jgi:hypothetical protein
MVEEDYTATTAWTPPAGMVVTFTLFMVLVLMIFVLLLIRIRLCLQRG